MSRHLCAAFNFHTKLVCVLQELTQDHMPSLNANTNVLHSFSKAKLTPTLVVDITLYINFKYSILQGFKWRKHNHRVLKMVSKVM